MGAKLQIKFYIYTTFSKKFYIYLHKNTQK